MKTERRLGVAGKTSDTEGFRPVYSTHFEFPLPSYSSCARRAFSEAHHAFQLLLLDFQHAPVRGF
jgi:hypothetical protein